jgi:hypothetical protein
LNAPGQDWRQPVIKVNRWQMSEINARAMGSGRLVANGVDSKQVAIIYDVAVCTLYKKFPAR